MSNAFCTRTARCCSLVGFANSLALGKRQVGSGADCNNTTHPGLGLLRRFWNCFTLTKGCLHQQSLLASSPLTAWMVGEIGNHCWRRQVGRVCSNPSLRVRISCKTHCSSLCICLSATIPLCLFPFVQAGHQTFLPHMLLPL